MSEQDINIDDFKFERIGGFIPTREEATYGLGNFFKALGDKFNIKDPSVRSGDATYYDIAESFIGKPTYRNEAFDTGSRDTGFGLADITPLGALYALDEAVNKLPERVKNNPLALLSIMRQPLQTTVETFDTDKFRDNAPLGENNMNLLPIDIATAGVATTPLMQPLGALGRQTARAIADEIKPVTDVVKFLRRQANKKPPNFDDMTKATTTGKPVFTSDEAFVKPTTTDVDLSKAKPEFMKIKPTKTMAMVQPNLTPDEKFFSGGELDDFAVQRFYNERLPKNRNLMVHHNINQIDLIKADRLGGLPAPSLAISKIDNPMMGYGDVVLVGSTKLAKPSYSNPVFRSDGYTVRMPKPDITINRPLMEFVKKEKAKFFKSFNTPAKIKRYLESKPDYQKLKDDEKLRLQKKLRNFISATEKHHLEVKEDMGQPSNDSIDLARGFEDRADNTFIKTMYAKENKLVSDEKLIDAYFNEFMNKASYQDRITKKPEQILKTLANTIDSAQDDSATGRYSAIPLKFKDISQDAVDPSVDPKYENWLINKRKDILAEGGEIQERLFVDYRPDGRRIYLPATLKNFVRLMKKKRGAGQEAMFLQGMGQLRAKITPQFRTISEIKAERSRITDTADFTAQKDELQNLYEDVIDLVGKTADDVFKKNEPRAGEKDSFGKTIMVDMRTTEELFEDLMLGRLGTHEYSKNYDKALFENKELQAKVKELKEKLISLPTEYFEAKPMRGVQLDEFVGAIVPKDVSPQVEAILKKNGLRIEKYDYDDSYGISKDDLSAEEFAKKDELPTKQNLFRRFPEVLFSIGAGASILPEIQRRNSLKMNEAPLT